MMQKCHHTLIYKGIPQKFLPTTNNMDYSELLSKRRNTCRSHHPSSLRGSVKGVLNINEVNRCLIPEAISLLLVRGGVIFESVVENSRQLVSEGRLLRRLSTANDTLNFATCFSLLLAMTRGGDVLNSGHHKFRTSRRMLIPHRSLIKQVSV